MTYRILIPSLAATLGLISCSTMNKVGQGSVAIVKKTKDVAASKVSGATEGVVHKFRPSRVGIVDIREKDLKDLPTGREKYLAQQEKINNRNMASRSKRSWFFNGPVNFVEPELPPPGSELDEILLPPKVN